MNNETEIEHNDKTEKHCPNCGEEVEDDAKAGDMCFNCSCVFFNDPA